MRAIQYQELADEKPVCEELIVEKAVEPQMNADQERIMNSSKLP